MARRKSLKAKDIERLENTSAFGPPLTTMTTFCCPTASGSVCGASFVC